MDLRNLGFDIYEIVGNPNVWIPSPNPKNPENLKNPNVWIPAQNPRHPKNPMDPNVWILAQNPKNPKRNPNVWILAQNPAFGSFRFFRIFGFFG